MDGTHYSWIDFLFTFGGLLFFLADIGLDAWAVVTFYQEEAYVCLGLLLLFLLGSSLLAQVYSWLWYRYDDYATHTSVESCLNPLSLKLLHVIQLGVYLRYASVMEVAVKSFTSNSCDPAEEATVSLSHDLCMLRLIETFTESAPQLVLILTVVLQRGTLDPMTMLKMVGSASAIACSVTMYHRSLRAFLRDRHQQTIVSSVIYFLWNLLLIGPRLTALALFTSVLPCYIFTHFLCSWLALFFFAWRSKTSFMDSTGGEWLFKATIGLIWYFSWFNVVDGRTRYKALFYHLYIVLDVGLLCGLWCWQVYRKEPYFEGTPVYAIYISVAIVAVYILGLSLRVLYYRFFHPKVAMLSVMPALVPDTVDAEMVMVRSMNGPPQPARTRENKRMRKLAVNFYS
ncbi:XK-related protein 8-like [Myripristis murdjan]|uniref:XK-related protein n=1 Tax=Myripristis murdjan TaxID=586833 RepID=A0A667ZUZ5_9TELE|nr:XK-related protein 8-like [Myripristis murdjan]